MLKPASAHRSKAALPLLALAALVGAASFSASCRHRSSLEDPSETESALGGPIVARPPVVRTPVSRVPAAAKTAFDSYARNIRAVNTLQSGCEPQLKEPPAGVPIRGTVVAFHGYTACPQQFLELADRLTSEGFFVLLPLLPGHGRVRTGGQDDVTFLPGIDQFRTYGNASNDVNALAALLPSPRMVTGLSVGGAVALEAARRSAGTYERQLIVAPFIDVGVNGAGTVLRVTVDTLSVMKGSDAFAATRSGWGRGCENERTNGRAGYCEFLLTNLASVQKFGRQTASDLRKVTALKSQFVLVEDDRAISNDKAIKAFDATGGAAQGALCVMPLAGRHSFISRFDNVGVTMSWLPAFFDAVVGFARSGTAFPTSGTSKQTGAAACRI